MSQVAEDMVDYLLNRLGGAAPSLADAEDDDDVPSGVMGSSGIGYMSDTVGAIEARQMWVDAWRQGSTEAERATCAGRTAGSASCPKSWTGMASLGSGSPSVARKVGRSRSSVRTCRERFSRNFAALASSPRSILVSERACGETRGQSRNVGQSDQP